MTPARIQDSQLVRSLYMVSFVFWEGKMPNAKLSGAGTLAAGKARQRFRRPLLERCVDAGACRALAGAASSTPPQRT
jgi:hypothetical protein